MEFWPSLQYQITAITVITEENGQSNAEKNHPPRYLDSERVVFSESASQFLQFEKYNVMFATFLIRGRGFKMQIGILYFFQWCVITCLYIL